MLWLRFEFTVKELHWKYDKRNVELETSAVSWNSRKNSNYFQKYLIFGLQFKIASVINVECKMKFEKFFGQLDFIPKGLRLQISF